METVSLVAAAVSVLLGMMAIALSVAFFKLSSDNTRQVETAAKGIGASVERLEKVFDRLYSDTFSMMRDTVTDMRKHIWPEAAQAVEGMDAREEAERRADRRIDELKREFTHELSRVMERVGVTDARIGSLREELMPVVERAMMESRMVDAEAREETLRDEIRRAYYRTRMRKDRVTADDIVERAATAGNFADVIREMDRMHVEGILSWEDAILGPETVISMAPSPRETGVRRSRRAIGSSRDQGADPEGNG